MFHLFFSFFLLVLPYYACIDISPPKEPPPGLTKAKIAAPTGPRPPGQKKITVKPPSMPPPIGAKIHVRKAKVLPPKGKDFFRSRTVQLTETPVSLLLFRSPF